MGLFSLAWKNIFGSKFRSLAICLCAALLACLALTATVLVRGAEASLHSNLERLGADLLVLPWGTMTEKIEGIRLMSAMIDGWMPRASMEKIAALDGVAEVSPQLFLATLDDSPYSPYPQMFLVAYDPGSDFTLRPWLQRGRGIDLAAGEAVAGAHITLPDGGSELEIFGTTIMLVDRLAVTETSLDTTLFVNFETAERMIAWSDLQDAKPLYAIPGTISAVMVRLDLDSNAHEMAVKILEEVPGVVPLETPNLFQTERRQMIGILRTLLGILSGIWVLAVVFMGLVFSIAVNERRFEIGVLRALGFNSRWILKSLLVEGAALALMGGFSGVMLAALGINLFGEQISGVVKIPMYFPTSMELVFLALSGQTLALASVTIAAFFPAWRISHEEVAVTMRT